MVRDKLIQLRVTEEEYNKIKERADNEMRTISNYLIKCGLNNEHFNDKDIIELLKNQLKQHKIENAKDGI